jgi:hypothetical protein
MDHVFQWLARVDANDITAIATAMTALIAYIAYKATRKSEMPGIDCVDEPEWFDGLARLRVEIFNRSVDSFTIESAEVLMPRGSKISEGRGQAAMGVWGTGPPNAPKERKLSLGHRLSPVGTQEVNYWDRLHYDFFVSPPVGWERGAIKIRVVILSRDRIIRRTRITLKRLIAEPKAMHQDAKTSR